MIGDLAATFVKLCHVLCNFSAIVIFEVAAWLQALLDQGYIYKGRPVKRLLNKSALLPKVFCSNELHVKLSLYI